MTQHLNPLLDRVMGEAAVTMHEAMNKVQLNDAWSASPASFHEALRRILLHGVAPLMLELTDAALKAESPESEAQSCLA